MTLSLLKFMNDDCHFHFDIVKLPLVVGDLSLATPYGVSILQLFSFARVSGHVIEFNNRNKNSTS